MALTLHTPRVVTTLNTLTNGHNPENIHPNNNNQLSTTHHDTIWSPVDMAFKLVEKTKTAKQHPDEIRRLLADVQNGTVHIYMDNDPRTFDHGQSALDVFKQYWTIAPKDEGKWQLWWKSHGRHAVQLVQQFQSTTHVPLPSSSTCILAKPTQPVAETKYKPKDPEMNKEQWYRIQHQMMEDVKQLQSHGSFQSLTTEKAIRVTNKKAYEDPPDLVKQFIDNVREWKDTRDFDVFVGNTLADNHWDTLPYDRNDLYHPDNRDDLTRIQSGEEVGLVTLDLANNQSFYLTWCFAEDINNFTHLVRTEQVICNQHVSQVLKQTHDIHLEMVAEGDFFYGPEVVILLKALEDEVESYRDLRVPQGCNTVIDHSSHIQLSKGFSIHAHNAVVYLSQCQQQYKTHVRHAHNVCQEFAQQVQGIPGVVLHLFTTFEDAQTKRCIQSMFREIEKTERKFNTHHKQLSGLHTDMMAYFQRYKRQVEEDWTIAQLQHHGSNAPVPQDVQQAFDTVNSVDELAAIPTEARIEVQAFTKSFQQHRCIMLKWTMVKEVRMVKTMIALGLWSLDVPNENGNASVKALRPPPSYSTLASPRHYPTFTQSVRNFNKHHPDMSKGDGDYFKEWYPSVVMLKKRVGDLYRCHNAADMEDMD